VHDEFQRDVVLDGAAIPNGTRYHVAAGDSDAERLVPDPDGCFEVVRSERIAYWHGCWYRVTFRRIDPTEPVIS
jgi:hypothetical protein